jgi:hypothetical protein
MLARALAAAFVNVLTSVLCLLHAYLGIAIYHSTSALLKLQRVADAGADFLHIP